MFDKVDIGKFDGKDWHLWKYSMEVFLLGQDLMSVVESEKPALIEAVAANDEQGIAEVRGNAAEVGKWIKDDRRAMMFLTQALCKNQLSLVVNCKSAKDIWDRLCSIHEAKNKHSIHMLHTKFYQYRMDPKDDVATHITKVEGLARALKDMGEEPTQTAVMAQILNSLPSSYRGFVSAWDSTPEKDQTMANLTARLLKEQELDRKMDDLSVREDRN